VTDDVHVQTQRGNLIFRGDSLELQIETNPGRNARTLGPTNFQIALSPGNFDDIPPSAFRFQGTTEGVMRDAAGGHNILVAARQTGAGYILEAAIPWSNLNLTPTPEMQLGLALNVNDNDTPDTAQQQMMISNVSTRLYADPTSWGRLTLQE
ncbi:MAG: sugar-binding protein, partial [Chloroflexota bacterium]